MSITFNPDPMTELEAVNMMLLSIGKAPVSTLAIAGINDVSFATTTLYNTVREVQARSWWFNREFCFPITPTAQPNGYVLIPDSVIDITTTDRNLNYIERNGKLYDLDTHTFNIGALTLQQPVKCDITWCFPFEQVPHVARSYIARRAGRTFQTQAVGSQLMYQFTKELEADAESELQRSELKNGGDRNMFATATRNNRIFNRQPGAYRRNW
jgi:Tail tubular protein